MKLARRSSSLRATPALLPDRGPALAADPADVTELRARLAEAEETVRAIRTGEVDAVVITRNRGAKVFTLEGTDRADRELIESMNEGALILTVDKTILYANQCFARMVKLPLEQVIGGSLSRFLSGAHRTKLGPLMKRSGPSIAKLQLVIHASDASQLPVQISVRSLAKGEGPEVTIGMVVTDMTEARRSEEMLRALSHRVVQVQETERGRVAGDLHDHITQLLCAILFRCQALVVELSTSGGPSMREALSLREMLGTTAKEVERISAQLRPGALDQLGLDAVMRATTTEFTERTGVPVKLDRVRLESRLPANTELALYRILQEALKNTAEHARAKQVTVHLGKENLLVMLTIKDDGIGFDPERRATKPKKKDGLGLLGMSERAAYVGGTFTIKSARREGTEITVRIPLPPDPIEAN